MKKILTIIAFSLLAFVNIAFGQANVISLFAGNGTGGDGGPALSAQLSSPVGLACDSQGNIYIADQGHFRVPQPYLNVAMLRFDKCFGWQPLLLSACGKILLETSTKIILRRTLRMQI